MPIQGVVRSGLRGIKVVLVVSLLGWVPALRAEMVTAKGQSAINEKEAIKDALRNALEQAGKVHVASWSKVENFQLAQDIIKTRVDGLVASHEVISRNKAADGVWTVEVKADVKQDVLQSTWADVEHLMEQLGEPKLMLFFDDLKQYPGQPEPSAFGRMSPVTSQVAGVLRKSGFRVIEKSRYQLMKDKKVEWAKADDHAELMNAVARDEGADLFIEGTAIAEGPTLLAESGLNQWKITSWSKGFWSDSGEMIFSTEPAGSKKNFRDPGDSGAIELLTYTAKEVAEQVREGLLENLTKQASGGGYLILQISNAAGERKYTIEDALKGIETIKSVKINKQYEGTVEFEVKTNLLIPDLVRVLERYKFAGFTLELREQRGQTIVLTAVTEK